MQLTRRPRNNRRFLPAGGFLLLGILLPCICLAQSPFGALRGTIQDSAGARIPSAKVAIQSIDSSVQRYANANGRGEFELNDLIPGGYRVTVRASNFADATTEVRVIVSFTRDVTVTLNPAPVQQKINIAAQASSITTQQIDTASTVHQGIIMEEDLRELPLAARSFANIAYLAPGTEPVEPSDPTKARITAVSTGGSSGLNNQLSVDGGDNSDDYIGGFLQNFSPDEIQEFAVRTAQEDADTGRTTAGSVVISTRHGSNAWHGDEAFFERAAALNARFPIDNPAPNPKQPFSRQDYSATLGGPIRKDKLWFFSSLVYVHENASIAYSPASLAQFRALSSLASQGLIPGADSIDVPDNVPVNFRDHLGTLRFDWDQSSKSQWFLRASADNYITHNALVQQAALPSTGAESHNNYMNLVLSNQYLFSPSW
ncbi:MAG: carboxypeptidase regulatory-like domain-containing protein, partial [Acidobacteriales bacterium]|nr:carboxypeptidase regulatory-like domain-containing protein [Terriglobales bacterium]